MPEIKVKLLRKFQLNDKRKKKTNVKVKLHRLKVLAVHHSAAHG